MSSRRKRRELERDIKKLKKQDYPRLIYQLKYQLTDYQANLLLKKIPDKKILFGDPLPKHYNELRKKGLTYNVNKLDKELALYTKEIIENREQINTFLLKKNEFESSFIEGAYPICEEILTDIETKICVSDWSIANKLLFYEYSEGFTKNKEVLSNIIDVDNNSIVNLLAKYNSLKVEKQLSISRINQDLLKLFSNLKPNIRAYFQFKLHQAAENNSGYLGSILNLESSSSIIDKYEAMIGVSIILSSKDFMKYELKKYITALSENINDRRLNNILFKIDPNYELDFNKNDKEIIEIFDLYTAGSYQKAIERLNTASIKWSNIFPLYIIYCKSHCYLGTTLTNPYIKDSLAFNILEAVQSFLLKDINFQSSANYLKKIATTLAPTSLSYGINNFINTDIGEEENHSYRVLMSSSYFNPLLVLELDKNEKIELLIRKLKSNTIALLSSYKFGYKENVIIDNVEEYRSNKYLLKYNLKNKNYTVASINLDYFDNDESARFYNTLTFNKITLVNNKVELFIHQKDYEKALEEIVNSNMSNINFNTSLHVKKIINISLEELKSNISTPILLHQYYPQITTKNDLWIALDNFLNSNKLNYPKDVIKLRNSLEKNKLIYLLKNICTQDIYDSSIWFENQDELDNERIEICTFLSVFDKTNFDEYIREISEIDRNLMIRQGVKQIDESKIYVDLGGLKKSLYKELSENLERSINLQSLPLDQLQKLDLKDDKLLIPYYDQDTKSIENIDSNIKITGYSRFRIFKEMFLKLRDNFIANNDYGLDTYLSTRIRHGTLLGEFRSNFENYHLITKKEENSKYKENTYWKGIVSDDNKIKFNFNAALSDFSHTIDNISNDLKNNKIQIKNKEKNPEGFFDYTYTDNMLLLLFSSKFAAIEDIDVFIEESLNELWDRTEKNLADIRNYISIDLKDEIIEHIVFLNNKIDEIIIKKDNPLYSELIRNIINCKTDIKIELDKIAAWFKRTNNKSINDFNFQLPIDSTLTTIKRIYKDFSTLNIATNIRCNKKIDGDYFQHFCYIFQNLIHNIIEHAQLQPNKLQVEINIEEEEDKISIKITNNISEAIRLESINSKITSIKEALDKEKNSDRIRNESGTGYIKINKTLYHDLKRKIFEINILPVDEERKFVCEIVMDNKNLFKI